MQNLVAAVTNLVNDEMHDYLRDDVALRLVNDLKIRVDEISNRFHLAFQLRIH